MPLFQFVITKDQKRCDESDPMELPDLAAAWGEATVTAGQMLRDFDGSFGPSTELIIQVQDEAGKQLRSLRITAESHH